MLDNYLTPPDVEPELWPGPTVHIQNVVQRMPVHLFGFEGLGSSKVLGQVTRGTKYPNGHQSLLSCSEEKWPAEGPNFVGL
jgi:hypothetical protein